MDCVVYPNGWKFTPHALNRMDQMGVLTREVHAALETPTLVYPGRRGRDGGCRKVSVAGRIAVVTSEQGAIVTILWHGAQGRTAQGPAA